MKPLEALAHLAEMGTPPDPETALRMSSGLGRSLRRIEEETLPFIAMGGGELQFVYGPYGRGKTHFLKALAQRARERGFVTAYVDCQENESPFQSLRETYRAIAAGMTPPETRRFFATSGITKIIEAQFIDKNKPEQRALIDRLKSNKALTPDFRNLVLAYCTEAVLAGSDEHLAGRLEALLAASLTYEVTVGALYRDHVDLPRPLGKLGGRNAAVWLRALLSLPRELGFAGTLVLFDETETVLMRRGRHRQVHLAHVRTLIDHMATGAFRGCAIYYATAEEFSETAKDLEALSQRIERTSIPELGAKHNPRAVWVGLDELTVPSPDTPEFFEELARNIIELGRDGGLSSVSANKLMASLAHLATEHVESINEARVREFVKAAAAEVVQSLARDNP